MIGRGKKTYRYGGGEGVVREREGRRNGEAMVVLVMRW